MRKIEITEKWVKDTQRQFMEEETYGQKTRKDVQHY